MLRIRVDLPPQPLSREHKSLTSANFRQTCRPTEGEPLVAAWWSGDGVGRPGTACDGVDGVVSRTARALADSAMGLLALRGRLRSRERALGTDQPKVPGTTAGLDAADCGPEDRKAGLENPSPGPENLRPGSVADLRRRGDQLPPGHPSSPVEADGRRKPPAPRLQDIALPEPLTDTEYAEHVKDVQDCLDKARVRGLATEEQHTIDTDNQIWSDERDAFHDSLITHLYAKAADVPSEHRAIIAGGLSGAGKSTVLDQYADIDRSQYLTINPDKIKEEMADRGMVPVVDGLSPMEASDLVHEESSYIARQLALLAQADGKNIVWDITMSSQAKTERRIDELRASGYKSIQGIFVDIPVELAVTPIPLG